MFAYCTWDDDKLDEMKRKLHKRSRDLLECVDNVQSSETSVSEGMVNFTSVLSNIFDPYYLIPVPDRGIGEGRYLCP